ncbi:hypothetical protein [Paenibacillus sp. YYML68]|uniref:hypothetical protein n=1 Tax=Paenibacillus sp. YYML68 TaxID=2909250 RepID=UPI002491D501|nr:hypothetical protein [Paenibacillus sp. YYML68]
MDICGGIAMKIRRSSDIEKAMKNADCSLKVEGLHVTDDENELIRKKLRGEISHAGFLRRALKLAKS